MIDVLSKFGMAVEAGENGSCPPTTGLLFHLLYYRQNCLLCVVLGYASGSNGSFIYQLFIEAEYTSTYIHPDTI